MMIDIWENIAGQKDILAPAVLTLWGDLPPLPHRSNAYMPFTAF